MHLTKYSVSVFAGVFLFLTLCIAPALADKRVALVIGNSSYQNVPKLPNPSADATAISEMFKNAGFEVVDLKIDVGNLDYKRAIRRFEDIATDADMAVVFFAGHGIEIRGTNYMIPIDAKLADERDALDEAIPLDRIVEAVSGAKRLRLVIIDACRDNPFSVTMKRQYAQRGTSRGLTRVEPQATDTLIAYAAKGGSTAEDGHGEHSPLTTALLNHLTSPGLDIRLAFGRVRDEVMKITGNRQEPFVYGSLGGGVISLVPAPSEPVAPAPSAVKADYELVEKIGTKKAWEVFLATYQTGFYAGLAKAQLAKIIASEAKTKVATREEPPPPAAPSDSSSDEQRAWEQIKDSSDKTAFDAFIKRYPNSPLALIAQRRLEMLEQLANEQEEKARAKREAALQRAEEERRAKAVEAASQKAAEQEVEDKRWMLARDLARRFASRLTAEEEQRAKAAEAEREKAAQLAAEAAARQAAEQRAEEERRAKTAKAEREKAAQLAAEAAALQAAEQRTEEERRAKAAEAEREKAAQLAAQQRAEDERWARAAEAERLRVAQLLAQQRAEEERRAQAAEVERQKAEQLAAQRAEEERKAKAAAEAERRKAEQLAAQRAEDERKAKAAAEAERPKAEQLAAQRAEDERKQKAAAEAERQKAEQLAAQRAEEERKAKAAEAERQKAEQLAAQRAEEERKAKAAAEAERQKAEQLAAQRAEEERKAKAAAEAGRQKAEQLAAQRAEEERKAKAAAEAERQKAEQLAAQRAEEERKAKAASQAAWQKAAQLAARQAAEEERKAQAAEAERQKAARLALQQAAEEERRAKAAAQAERQKAAELAAQQAAEEKRRAKAAADAERQKAADLAAQQAAEAKGAEAERQKAAAAAQQIAEDQRRAKQAVETSTPEKSLSTSELIHSAQIELARLGCFSGDPDGTLNAATQAGINRYLFRRGHRDSQTTITDGFVSELRGQQTRVCPLDCPPGQIVDGNTCVAEKKGSKPTKAARHEEEIQHKPTLGHARTKQEAAQPRPHVHQEVSATPRQYHSGGAGGGGGGGGTTIGVGF